MKQIYKSISVSAWIAVSLLTLLPFSGKAQLSGTYTINASASASSTNYKTFASAVSDLVSGTRADGGPAQGPAVGGAVVFNVASGTYTEQIKIGAITNTSATRTVTFQAASGDSSLSVLQYAAGSSAATNYVVNMNGARWVVFNKMTIKRTGSGSYSSVFLYDANAARNTIKNCQLFGDVNATTSTTQALVYSSGLVDTFNTFQQNLFMDGAMSMYWFGAGTSAATQEIGTVFKNNIVKDFYYMGLYIYYQDNLTIEGNTFTSTKSYTTMYGIYSYYCSYGGSSGPSRLVGNKIHLATGYYGIMAYYWYGTSSNRNLIANNMVSTGSASGYYTFYCYYPSYCDIVYNSFCTHFAVPNSMTAYLYLNSGNNVNIKNNIFKNVGTNAGNYTFYNASGVAPLSQNYNNYYGGGSTPLYMTTGYSDLASWKAGTGLDANSKAVDPSFTANLDLHLNGIGGLAMNGAGTAVSVITTDVDGQSRGGSPDIGADEIFPPALDAGVTSIDSPTVGFCGTTQNVYARFSNFGTSTLTSVAIHWSVNGSAQTTFNWTGSVGSGGTSGLISLGSYTFSSSTTDNMKVWTESPNGGTDGNAANDTFIAGRGAALNGSYTIGGTTPDFTTFTSAVAALNAKGVCGPTVFNVRDGAYTESITLIPIGGASATNTITFQSQSGDSTKVNLNFPSTAANFTYAVKLNGADYVNFKKMTIRRTGSNWGQAVIIDAGAHHDGFYNCRIASNNINSQAILALYDLGDSAITVKNCYVGRGLDNIFFSGSNTSSKKRNILVEGCILDSGYRTSLLFQYTDDVRVVGNTFTNNSAGSGSNTNYGMYYYYCNSDKMSGLITNNKFYYTDRVYMGIYAYYAQGTASLPIIIANNILNMQGGGAAYAYPYSIYTYYHSYVYIFYNTIHLSGWTGGNTAYNVYGGYGSNNKLKNNIIWNTGGTTLYNLTSSSYATGDCDYNDLFSGPAGFSAYWNGVQYTSLSAYKTATGQSNTISADPQFYSSTDYHQNATALNNKGTSVSAYWNTDMDGATRSATTPDIGADEYTPQPDDAGVSSIDSPASFCSGTKNVRVTLKNFGTSTLTSADVDWKVNGVAQTQYNWTGSLASGTSVQINLGPKTFSANTNYTIKAWASNPNGTTDGNAGNDTNTTVKISALTGTYTISLTGSPDFGNFSSAVSALISRGVCGPVVFNVANGIYNDYLTIPQITGTSSVNTVTFQSTSGDSSLCVLQRATTTSSPNAVIWMQGGDWFTFKGMTIRSVGSSTYGYPLYIYGTNASTLNSTNNTFKNCVIRNGGTSSYCVYLYSSNGTNRFNTLDNCWIIGNNPNYAMYWYDYNVTYGYGRGNVVKNCTIDSGGTYGIICYYSDSAKILNNTFKNQQGATNYGLYTLYATGNYECSGNNFYYPNTSATTIYAIYPSTNTFTSGTHGLISNNMVTITGSTNGTYFGIYPTSNTYLDIYNNSVYMNETGTGTHACLYSTSAGSYTVNVVNNSFYQAGSGTTKFALYSSNITYWGTMNYNNYYAPNATYLAYFNTNCVDLFALQSASFKDGLSKSINPSYIAPTTGNLHSNAIGLNNAGTSLASVTLDYDKQTRGASPDIGADEFTPPPADAGVISIDSPSTGWCAGTKNVKVTIKNFGTNTLTSATVSFKVNGGSATNFNWTGSLSPFGTTQVTVGTYAMLNNTTYNFKAYTSSPNGGTDGDASNDTGYANGLQNALSGTYTIGGTTPDFNLISDAMTALNTRGVCGAVTFNIRDGQYNAQMVMTNIGGSSATNTITFQSQSLDSTKVTIKYPALSTAANNFVVQFNGCKYITFNKVTIQRTYNNTYASVVEITGAANNNTIKNCRIIGWYGASTLTNYALVNNLATTQDYNNTFDNNNMKYGSYGFYWQGISTVALEAGNKIKNNIIDSCYYMGMYMIYQDAEQIIGNTVSNIYYDNASIGYGIYRNSCQNGSIVTKNKVYLPRGGYAGYFINCLGISTAKQLIASNFFSVVSTVQVSYGLYTSGGTYQNFFDNNIRVGGSTTVIDWPLYIASGTNNNIQANVLANFSGLSSTTTNYAIYVASSTYVATENYNDLYTIGTNIGYWSGTAYSTFTLWKFNTGKDGQGVNLNPTFTSASDLHVANPGLNGVGQVLAGVSDDVDGQTRSASTPDIGADEFTPSPNDAGISGFTAPASGCAGSTVSVIATISNLGTSTLTSANIDWKINGTSQTQVNWTGSLAPGNSASVTLSTSVTLLNGANVYKAWTSSPNGGTDGNYTNDTFVNTVNSSMSGYYTIGGTTPSYTTFTAAVADLVLRGICGKVVFDVRSGTYTEQVSLPAIAGSSSTNRIIFRSQTGNKADVMLQFPSSTVSTNNWVFDLNDADYITIQDMSMQRTGSNTYAQVLNLRAPISTNGVTYSTFKNLNLSSYINTSSSSSPVYTGSFVHSYDSLFNCVISGGYYGVYWYGYSTGVGQRGVQNVLSNNTISDWYYYGMILYYQEDITVQRNVINDGSYAYYNYPTYLYYWYSNITGCKFSYNKIMATGGCYYSMYAVNLTGTATAPILISNNFINNNQASTSGYTSYGLYLSTPTYCNFYNNNIYINNGYTASVLGYGVYISGGSSNNWVNNAIHNKTAGTMMMYIPSSSYFTTINYNSYYFGGANFGYYNGTTYATFSAWKSGTGKDANSVYADPLYISAASGDLHVNNPISLNAAGTSLAVVPDDIDGTTRSGTPDIGADEFTPPADDAGIFTVDSPNGVFCGTGIKNIKVTLKNFGTNTLTSVNIDWRMNGVLQTQYAWTGSLALGATTQVTIGTYNLVSGTYQVKSWTSSPNGQTDPTATNDTSTGALAAQGLSGTYTIGGTTPDFATFTAAVAALNAGGVCGTVTFNVRDGQYNERITLGNIGGTSPTSQVIFQSQSLDSTKVMIDYPSGGATASPSQAVIRLDGAKYITFRKMSIRRSGSASNSDVACLELRLGASYNTFDGMRMYSGKGNTSSTPTSSPIVCYQQATNCYKNVFKNNIIKYGGYYGSVYWYNPSAQTNNTLYQNNLMDSAYGYSTYLYYSDSMKFTGNTISNSMYGYGGYYGFYPVYCNYLTFDDNKLNYTTGTYMIAYIQYCNNMISFSRNIMDGYTYYGLYFYNCVNASTMKAKIYNNMLNMSQGTSPLANLYYGVYNYSCSYQDWQYNTIRGHHSYASGYLYYYYPNTSYTKNFNFNNNTIENPNSAGYIFYGGTTINSYVNSMNNNNYYMGGSAINMYNGGAVTGLASWVTSCGHDTAAKSVSSSFLGTPLVYGMYNLHSASSGLNNAGKVISGITTDIDGDTRSGSTPDIGADEFTVPNNDAGVFSSDSPNSGFCSGTKNVWIKIKNFGAVALTSVTIDWKVNGVSQTTYNWTGSIAAGNTSQVNIGNYNFTGSSYQLKYWTSSPNGSTDANALNDTLLSPTLALSLAGGTYTIGGTTPDYADVAAAADDLTLKGICGPVVFNIRDGVYTGKVTLGVIAGAGPVNTVTFQSQSMDSTKVTIDYPASTSSSQDGAVVFNGCDYVTFNKMTFTRSGGISSAYYGSLVLDFKSGSTYNTVKNCRLYANKFGASSTFNCNIMNYSANTGVDYNTFDNNLLKYGYYSIMWYGSGSNNYTTFKNNTLDSFGYMGAYTYYTNYLTFNNNVLSNPVTNTYGMYLYYPSNLISFSKNIIHSSGTYGLYFYNNTGNTASTKAIFANNMIYMTGTTTGYAIYSYYNMFTNYFNNTVYDNRNPTSATYSWYCYGYPNSGNLGGNNFINNNIYCNSANLTPIYAYYLNTSYANIVVKNNNYFNNAGGTYIGYSNGSAYTTLANWKAGLGNKDTGALNVNPLFVTSPALYKGVPNMHMKSASLNGAAYNLFTGASYLYGTPAIPTDIDGEARTITGDIGADEYTPPANDASVFSADSPTSGGYCPQTNRPIWITIKNNGTSTLTSVTVQWKVNGVAQTDYAWTGSLASGGTSQVNIGTYTLLASTPYVMKYWTTLPNGTTDGDVYNDTLLTPTLQDGLSGTYTIGGSSPNYVDFTSAIAAINLRGLCGPVTFTVRDGTYFEQITLLNKANAVNTISFVGQSGDSSKVTLVWPSTASGNNATVLFNGAKYYTFSKIGIRRANTSTNTDAAAISFINGASYNTVTNCRIWGGQQRNATPLVTPSNVGQSVVYFPGTGSGVSACNFNQIKNSSIKHGYTGIYWYGGTTATDSGNVFSGNILDSNYQYGAYMLYSRALTFNTNVVRNMWSTSSYGILMQNDTGTISVSRNMVENVMGPYGIYLASNWNHNSAKMLFSNNMSNVGGTLGQYPLYASSNRNILIYNNTFNIASTSASVTYAFIAPYTSIANKYTEVVNNIFRTSNTVSTAYPVYYALAAGSFGSYMNSVDNNVYYNTVTPANVVNANGTTYATLAAWKTACSKDSNALNTNPYLKLTPLTYAVTNLHTLGNALNAAAKSLSAVTVDIDGESRSGTPDIGADEFTPAGDDAGITAITGPVNGTFCTGSNNVTVNLFNYGTNNLTSTTIKWWVNGVAQTDLVWTGSLPTGAQTNLTIGSYSFAALTTYTISAKTAGANLSVPIDGNPGNDSMAQGGLKTSISGTFTIGGTAPDYYDFATAITDLTTLGVCGPVTFNIRDNTYIEQLILPQISGTSSTNRITFQSQSADSTKVTIFWAGSSSSTNNFTIGLNGADWVTFKNLTIRRWESTAGFTYNTAVDVRNSSQNNTFNRCLIKGNPYATTSTSHAVVNSTYTGVYASDNDSGNTFRECRIAYGSYGFYWLGSINSGVNYERSNKIDSCIIERCYNYGIYAQYQENMVIKNSIFQSFSNATTNNTAAYGIYLISHYAYAAGQHLQVYGNKINIPNSGYGLYLSSVTSSAATNGGVIYNNFISVGGSTTAYGWYNTTSGNLGFTNNNINVYSTSTAYAAYIASYGGIASGISIVNNIFSMTSTTASTSNVSFSATTSGTGGIGVFNNNDFYHAGTAGSVYMLSWNGVNYTNTAANMNSYRTTYSKNYSSISVDPGFTNTSTNDLHVSSCWLKSRGVYVTLATDIDGGTRDATPDIGADEFTGSTATMWTGAVSHAAGASSAPWGTSGNWCMDDVPTCSGGQTVNITAISTIGALTYGTSSTQYYPTVAADATVKDVSIAATCSLTINSGVTFNGCGTFTNSGVLTTNGKLKCTDLTLASGSTLSNPSTGSIVSSGTFTNGISASLSGKDTFNNVTNNGTITVNSGAGFKSSGTFTNSSTSTSATFGANSLLTDVTNSSGKTFTVSSGITVTGTGTFSNSGTLTTTGKLVFNNLTLVAGSTLSNPSTGSIVSGGTFTNNISASLSGKDTFNNVSNNSGATITVNSGAGFKSSGTFTNNGTVSFNANSMIADYTNSATKTTTIGTGIIVNGTSGNFTNSGTLTLTTTGKLNVNNLTFNSGSTVTAGSSGSIRSLGTFTNSMNPFDNNSKDTFNNVTNNASSSININTGSSFYCTGTLTNNGTFTAASNTWTKDLTNGSSLVFNSGNTLYLSGNLVNTGSITANGILDINGSSAQNIAGATYKTVNITGNGLKTLTSDATIKTALTFTTSAGQLLTGSNALTIDTAATLTENDTNMVLGKVKMDDKFIPKNTTFNFGGIGVNITSGPYKKLGKVDVVRYTGSSASRTGQTGAPGIDRYYDITPDSNSQLGATLKLNYNDFASELNGISESNLMVFRSIDGGTTWEPLTTGVSFNTSLDQMTKTNVDHFSQWTFGDNTNQLPVELTKFTANMLDDKTVTVDWTTASELNNDHFDVERSVDGVNFTKVGEVAGFGTTAQEHEYNYLDNNVNLLHVSTLYYRLKQVDYNGDFTYSIIRNVYLNGATTDGLKVWYNDAESKMSIIFNSKVSENITIKLVDMQGKTLSHKNVSVSTGINQFSVGTTDVAKGVYNLVIATGERTITHRVMKY